MKRILFLNSVGYIGGAEKSLIELVSGMPTDRFRSLVVTLGTGPLVEEFKQRGIEALEMPLPPAVLKLSRRQGIKLCWILPVVPLRILPLLNRLLRLIRNRSIDAIHTNGLKAHLLGCLITILSPRPLIWHFRDYPKSGGYSLIFRSLARIFPSGIIANSRAVKERLGNLTKIKVVYNGIDTSLFQPGERIDRRPGEFGIKQNDLLIGTIGHFAPLKGYDDLIRALPLILEKVPQARLLIAGEAIYPAYLDYKKKLHDLIDRLGIADKIIFTGQRDDLPALLNIFDIFVLPSWSEGFGRVNLEAMAAGKPVVSTNVGGIPEVIIDGKTGILVPPHDPDGLAEALIRLARDKDLRVRMGIAGIQQARVFSLEKMVSGVVDFYDTLIFSATD
jgi:glycosyltransferase involved in cell wall biosynthesis